MGLRRLSPLEIILAGLLVVSACAGSHESADEAEPAGGTTAPTEVEIPPEDESPTTTSVGDGPTDPELLDPDDGDTDASAEPVTVSLAWEPMGGPPGGNVLLFAQDRVRAEHLYASTGRGLYHSQDLGDTWHVLDESISRGVTSITFPESGTFACTETGMLAVTPGAEPAVQGIGDPCYTSTTDGSALFASRSSEMLGEPRFELRRFEPESGFEWTDVTPPSQLWADLIEQVPGVDVPFISVEDLTVADGRLLALVGVSGGPFAFDHLATRVLASDDGGASWIDATPGFDEPLVTQHLVGQPDGATVVALAHLNRVDGPFFPLADLGRISVDGGRTWQPLTEIRDIIAPTISDADIIGDRIVLTNVDFSIVELSLAGGELLERRPMPEVAGYSIAFALDELAYDVADPEVLYGQGYLGWEGIIRSRDGGATWERLTGGMVAPPVANLTTHPDDPGVLIAGGNLGYLPHITRDGGDSWQPLVGGSSMADEVTFSPHDTDLVLMMSERSDLLRSTDGGSGWAPTAPEFSGNRVYDVTVTPDGDTLYVPNLGTNVSTMTGLRPDDDVPRGANENLWVNLNGAPDYSYAIATAPDGTLLATQSPKKFEDHAGIWRYEPELGTTPEAWSEIHRVDGATGITDLTVAPSDPTVLYAGVVGPQGAVLASSDGGESWQPTHGDEFGFVTVHTVALDPANPDVVYAAPWGAGLFRSDDGGASWTEMTVPTVSVATVIVDPEDSEHLLLGDRTRPVVWETGDGGTTWEMTARFDDADYYRVLTMLLGPDGLYVSLLRRTDQGLAVFAGAPVTGATFRIDDEGRHEIEDLSIALLAMTTDGDDVYGIGHIAGAYQIVDDRALDIGDGLPDMGFNNLTVGDGDVLLAGGADVDLAFRSRIGDPDVVNNIYRQTGESGWEPLLDGDPFSSGVKQLAEHPNADGVYFAATGTGLYVSTDDGATWRPENDGLEFPSIGAMAIGDDRVVLGLLGGGAAVGEIQADHSVRWTTPTGPRPEIGNVKIVVDPFDAERLWTSSYPGGVFRSEDGGRTWAETNFGLPSFEVTDPLLEGYYSLAADPSTPDRLYLAVFQHGVFETNDGGGTWRPIANYGRDRQLMRSALTQIVVDPADPNRLWLATANRGVYTSPDRGVTWVERNEGMESSQVFAFTVTDAGQLIAGTAGYGVYLLEPGAASWEHLGNPIGTGDWATWDRRLYQYGSFLFDPLDKDRVFLGQFPGGFFVSEDRGTSWFSSHFGIGNDGIFSLTASPEQPDLLFAGTYNGIMRSDNAGGLWHDTSTGMPPEQWPFSVVIDDEKPAVMYTATKNGQNKGFCERNHDTFCGLVMKSEDHGATWFEIMDGLDPFAEYYMLIIDPRDHDVLYVSSSRGIFVSTDAGRNWEPANDGLPQLSEFFVRDNVAQNLKLTTDEARLVFAIVGYGVWEAELPPLPDR